MEEKIAIIQEDKNLEIDTFATDKEFDELDFEIQKVEKEYQKLTSKRDKMTVKLSRVDYAVAAGSGFLCAIIDLIFLTKVNLNNCRNDGEKILEPIIKSLGKSRDLTKAIEKLEKKSKRGFASDPNIEVFGGSEQHHLRDFGHHPTFFGLFCSLLTQFTGKCYGTNDTGKLVTTAVLDTKRIGSNAGEKLYNGIICWFIHLASDMCGTSKTSGRGNGIPGPILSLAKELSSVLPNKENGVSNFISDLFTGALFADRDSDGNIIPYTNKPIDFRTEIGLAIRQSIPVFLNEVAVRAFYFISRLTSELKKKKENSEYIIEWKSVCPIGNVDVARMVTIADAVFSTADISSAVITSLIECNGSREKFFANLVLRVNYPGLGKLLFSSTKEIISAITKGKNKKEVAKKAEELEKLKNMKIHLNVDDSFKTADGTK